WFPERPSSSRPPLPRPRNQPFLDHTNFEFVIPAPGPVLFFPAPLRISPRLPWCGLPARPTNQGEVCHDQTNPGRIAAPVRPGLAAGGRPAGAARRGVPAAVAAHRPAPLPRRGVSLDRLLPPRPGLRCHLPLLERLPRRQRQAALSVPPAGRQRRRPADVG